MSSKPTITSTATPPAASMQRASPTNRRPPSGQASATPRRGTVPIAQELATLRQADPPWAAELRGAVDRLAETDQRYKHALARLPVAQAAVFEASLALARAEAAEPVEAAGVSVNGVEAAHQRLVAAEAEVARAERIVTALAEAVEERREALRPLIEPGLVGMAQWTDGALAGLDAEFIAAMEHAANIAARAAALIEASGADHLLSPFLRLRLPMSLTRSDAILAIGQQQGKHSPQETDASTQAGRLRMLLDAARAAAEPVVSTTSNKKAA